jgi:hypothetical protein
MEKLKPNYLLTDIKAAFADPTTLNRSFVSKQGADNLGMDDAAVVASYPRSGWVGFREVNDLLRKHSGLARRLSAKGERQGALCEIHAGCWEQPLPNQLQGSLSNGKEPEKLSRHDAQPRKRASYVSR